jgi:hypothetical protein
VRISTLLDTGLLAGLALLAAWTLAYWAALAGVVSSSAAFWAWVAAAPVVVALVVRYLRVALRPVASTAPWFVLGLCTLAAVAAMVIVRPDLDDAAYVVRTTWIAAHGDVRVGDPIFSGGRWPGMPAESPYLASVEALLGWLSRVTGISAGSVTYLLVTPVASAAAVWALFVLFRSWGTRRASLCVALAALFLVMGGATPASWGNLGIARIWQGKVAFLAVVLPLLYALMARFWTATTVRERGAALAALAVATVSALGLTPAAVFVVPAIGLAGMLPGLLERRWGDAIRLVAAVVVPPLAVGVLMRLVGHAAEAGMVNGGGVIDPWPKVLGAGWPVVVVGAAVLMSGLAVVRPGWFAACDEVARRTVLAAVLAGALLVVPSVWLLATHLMGSDAIAWRLTWVVPVPAIVGLLGGLPRWRRVPTGALMALAAGLALVVGGLPLWSSANGAWLARPGAWKLPPPELAAARWVAGRPVHGRVLAPLVVSEALGVVTADARPVGSRPDYLDQYRDQPGAQVERRERLQRLADGGTDPADLAAAPGDLSALHVTVVCGQLDEGGFRQLLDGLAYLAAYRGSGLTCLVRS